MQFDLNISIEQSLHSQTVSPFFFIVYVFVCVCAPTCLPVLFCFFVFLWQGSLHCLNLTREPRIFLSLASQSWSNMHFIMQHVSHSWRTVLGSSCLTGKLFTDWHLPRILTLLFCWTETVLSQEDPAQKWIKSPVHVQSRWDVAHPCTQWIVRMPSWAIEFYLLERI